LVIEDFAMNTMCAAGTGSFLDQQSHRLGYDIDEFSQLSLKSTTPPRVAGRCSVFAKTDMIHLQQGATPDYEIIAGLCLAMARNLKSNIAKGKTIRKPVVFQGGVAHNLGVRQAFRKVFDLEDEELIIPPHFCSLGAIGAVLAARENPTCTASSNPLGDSAIISVTLATLVPGMADTSFGIIRLPSAGGVTGFDGLPIIYSKVDYRHCKAPGKKIREISRRGPGPGRASYRLSLPGILAARLP